MRGGKVSDFIERMVVGFYGVGKRCAGLRLLDFLFDGFAFSSTRENGAGPGRDRG